MQRHQVDSKSSTRTSLKRALLVFGLVLVVPAGKLWSRPAISRELFSNHVSAALHNDANADQQQNDQHNHRVHPHKSRTEHHQAQISQDFEIKFYQDDTRIDQDELIRTTRESLALAEVEEKKESILNRLQILESYDPMLNEFALQHDTFDGLLLPYNFEADNGSLTNRRLTTTTTTTKRPTHNKFHNDKSRNDMIELIDDSGNGDFLQPEVDSHHHKQDLHHQLCLLKLPFQLKEEEQANKVERKHRSAAHVIDDENDDDNYCLPRSSLQRDIGDSGLLANSSARTNQIPPYVLNLYKRMASQASSQIEAVRLMPYQSLAMRSFRQPDVAKHRSCQPTTAAPRSKRARTDLQEQDDHDPEGKSIAICIFNFQAALSAFRFDLLGWKLGQRFATTTSSISKCQTMQPKDARKFWCIHRGQMLQKC